MPISTKEAKALYCDSLTHYSRLKTREVFIGEIPLGGNNPIRLQSMTTTDTMDTQLTVEQSIRMIEAGCEYVRITAPSKKDAENLRNIRDELYKRGYTEPLVADIHFTPNAAELAAGIVEKVRVNPGNYADKKKFDHIEYTDESYQAELDRIRERFTPLVSLLKKHKTALRIGTNHGSLSDRIMSRFGDTPLGMVESALEFLHICRDNDFHDIVFSMKASNTQIMVQAYRLLVYRMKQEGMNYPLHLGVTEAGDGEDGRIKSAVGIGTLLEDGIGDTIRVSLTEEPEFELPVAKLLADRYADRHLHESIEDIDKLPYNPFEYNRRTTEQIDIIGGEQVPVSIIDISHIDTIDRELLKSLGYHYLPELDKWKMSDQASDFIYTGKYFKSLELPGSAKVIIDWEGWEEIKNTVNNIYPLLSAETYLQFAKELNIMHFVECSIKDLTESFLLQLENNPNTIPVLVTENIHGMAEQRAAFIKLMNRKIKKPVIIKCSYSDLNEEKLTVYASTDAGALFIDGMGDGIWLQAPLVSAKTVNSIQFGILQATRTRISKTEYISCPSCGRTLFDLQETTAKIREKTHHLKGVKIGIMGCIVNGPGEMADADFGYVGSGVGKITLYKGKEVVKRNIDSAVAVDELIQLIKTHNMWTEKEE